jgi:hypothetical protein
MQAGRFCSTCGAALTGTFCAACGAPAGPEAAPGVAPVFAPTAPPARKAANQALGAVILAVILALGFGAWVVLGGSKPTTHTVTGSLVLIDASTNPSIYVSGSSCHGTGGYLDLHGGAEVRLKNENGTLLSSTILGSGTGTAHLCTFSFTLTDVPDDAKFYVVNISHRGDVSNSHAEMVDAGWAVDLTIGS